MITHPFETILGDIPKSWDSVSLRECLATHSSGDWGDERGEVAVKVLRSTNFTSQRNLDFGDVAERFFSGSQASKFQLRSGDILLERSGGGPSQPVGRVVVLEEDLPGYGFSNFVQLLRVDPNKMHADYVAWCLYTLQASGIVERLQHQTTQMRNLEFRDYLRVRLPKPPRDEQVRIAEALCQADKAFRKTADERKAVRGMRSALLQRILERGIPGDHEDFNAATVFHARIRTPKAWRFERLGMFLTSVEYGTNAASNEHSAGYPVIAIPQVVAPVLRRGDWPYSDISAAEADQLRLRADDVLLVRTNGNPEFIGKSTVITPELAEEHLVFASYLIRLRPDTTQLLGAYLNAFMMSPLGRRQARALANTSAGNHNIGARSLKRFLIPLPPIAEQEAIVSLLQTCERYRETVTTKSQGLARLKRSLLQNVLTGKASLAEAVAA